MCACVIGWGWGVIGESKNKQTNREHVGNWALCAWYQNTSRIICMPEICCYCCLLCLRIWLSQVSSRQNVATLKMSTVKQMHFYWSDPVSRWPICLPYPSPPQKKKKKTRKHTHYQHTIISTVRLQTHADDMQCWIICRRHCRKICMTHWFALLN